MKIEGKRQWLLSLFRDKLFVADGGPVLTDPDVGGRTGEEVLIRMGVDNENNEVFIAFPFKSLDQVELYDDGSYRIRDENGFNTEVWFFDTQTPVVFGYGRY